MTDLKSKVDLRDIDINAHPTLSAADWRARVEADMKGRSADKLIYKTGLGPEIQPLYTAQDLAGLPLMGAPGAPRSPQRRVICAHPEPAVTHTLAREALDGGADAIELPLYNTTGPGGVQIRALADLDAALGEIDAWTSITAGGAFDAAAALLIARWQRRGIEAPLGALNADPLGALAAGRPLPWGLDVALSRLAMLARYTHDHLPGVTAVAVDTTPYHHAGATPAQDIAYALATGVAYLRALVKGGLGVDEAAAQIVFRFSLSPEQFTEIARLRAARALWSRVLEVAGGRPAPMRQVTRLSPRSLTRRDPWVNMLRDTAASFAGIVGGAEALISTPFDAALGRPEALGRRAARNTPLILCQEAGLDAVADPAGGAYLIEALTAQLAEAAWSIFQEIEAEGEMAEALRGGRVKASLDAAWRARLARLARRQDEITGVSAFASTAPRLTREAVTRPLSPQVAEPIEFEGFEDRLKAAGEGFPLSALIAVDEPYEIPAPTPHTLAEPFERLMDAAESKGVSALLANLGALAQHTARATFSENLLHAGGIKVTHSPPHIEAADVAAALKASGARIVVLCGSDALYEAHAADVAARLKAAGARDVLLAGKPGALEGALRAAGVDRFIHLGGDALETLTYLLRREGAL
ncbi:methylmalonyl-CoA mutase [Myxococcota bacterium]|nr:methylmalonyl-CoA mutase [Myxococcota bacterium]MBU1431590.1 methylmalonyl-CoA mutase [Myxococcota bacterium]MBU1900397.1 methylmalonyl-CoA mutase [Myxococcota bacterium]